VGRAQYGGVSDSPTADAGAIGPALDRRDTGHGLRSYSQPGRPSQGPVWPEQLIETNISPGRSSASSSGPKPRRASDPAR
jgi:hypothetical protein